MSFYCCSFGKIFAFQEPKSFETSFWFGKTVRFSSRGNGLVPSGCTFSDFWSKSGVGWWLTWRDTQTRTMPKPTYRSVGPGKVCGGRARLSRKKPLRPSPKKVKRCSEKKRKKHTQANMPLLLDELRLFFYSKPPQLCQNNRIDHCS